MVRAALVVGDVADKSTHILKKLAHSLLALLTPQLLVVQDEEEEVP